MRYALPITIILIVIMLLLSVPCSAMYSFEGVPLGITAQGAIRGEVVSSWSLGLSAPPYSHEFALEHQPAWARVYTGVWGGTEKYRGWTQIDINGKKQEKIELFGEDDMDRQVYESGNGVYWISFDGTGVIGQGDNTITVTTSRGEPNNKLDGRVYGIIVVALIESENGPVTQYWIADGNENLHGEGWAGANPTRHDSSAVTFSAPSSGAIRSAELTTLLLTSTRGQPDYITFNGQDLGILAIPESEYLPGARDIGNERSSDANGKSGIDTRYADLEVFDVTSLLKESNTVVFERGRDLNGDGVIVTASALSEGEDYIHPVLAMLVVTENGDSLVPELSVDPITIQGAYQGETATISAVIRNNGIVSSAPVEVVFSVDGVPVATTQVIIGYEGIREVEGSWQAAPGDHTVTVTVKGDTDTSNNAASRSITVGSLPDLSVSLGDPGSPGTGGTSPKNAPFPFAGAIAGGLVLAWWMARKRPSPVTLPALFLTIGIFALVLVPSVAGAGSGVSEFPIPVTVRNTGGSNAPAFVLSLYLDGEKVAEQTVTEGVSAGGAITVTIPLFTTAGRHTLRVVADERGTIPEKDRANNSDERVYEFS
ncbi:MAG TPA: DUF3344 domain-containing protein [Methanolinea sp.]|nr:DUF3344 domain-containing protein [Methanolinea sp.]